MPLFIDRSAPEQIYGLPHVPGGYQGVKVSVHQGGAIMVSDEHPIPEDDPGCVDRVTAGVSRAEGAYWQDKRGRCDGMIGGEAPLITSAVMRYVAKRMPGLDAAQPAFCYRCPYTSTEDGEWVVGPHPSADGVFVACAFSGEGFKFGAAVGEAVADMALGVPERVHGLAALAVPSRLLARRA